MELDPISQKFILHWGEMGARWGMNRTVSQLHGLLYPRRAAAARRGDRRDARRGALEREHQPEGAAELGARAASPTLMGERRDHYVALQDIYEIFRVIVEGRKRREIDPTMSMLRDCVLQADEATPDAVLKKIEDVLGFIETLNGWYEQMKTLKPGSWLQLMRMGAKVQTLLKKTG